MLIAVKVRIACVVPRNEIYSVLAVWKGSVGRVSGATADLHCAQTCNMQGGEGGVWTQSLGINTQPDKQTRHVWIRQSAAITWHVRLLQTYGSRNHKPKETKGIRKRGENWVLLRSGTTVWMKETSNAYNILWGESSWKSDYLENREEN